MKLIKSQKLKLPDIFFISDRSEIKDLPKGMPFIYGDNEQLIVRILEYEILMQAALRTGLRLNFAKILKDNGYDSVSYWYSNPEEFKIKTKDDVKQHEDGSWGFHSETELTIKDYIKDNAVYVSPEVLKELNIIPTWGFNIQSILHTNIFNYANYDYNLYNKKHDLVCGDMTYSTPKRNLISIDISSSIPKGASAFVLSMCKNLAENFFADILITGSKTTLYDYTELDKLNIDTIYQENGTDNDQIFFIKTVSVEKDYNTCIIFGDNHNPGQAWNNIYNNKTRSISLEEGREINKFRVDKLICFHTSNNREIPGYATWFKPSEIEHIENWVKYF